MLHFNQKFQRIGTDTKAEERTYQKIVLNDISVRHLKS